MEKATKAATEYTEQVQQMKGRAEEVDKNFSKLEGKDRSVREEARYLTQTYKTDYKLWRKV